MGNYTGTTKGALAVVHLPMHIFSTIITTYYFNTRLSIHCQHFFFLIQNPLCNLVFFCNEQKKKKNVGANNWLFSECCSRSIYIYSWSLTLYILQTIQCYIVRFFFSISLSLSLSLDFSVGSDVLINVLIKSGRNIHTHKKKIIIII